MLIIIHYFVPYQFFKIHFVVEGKKFYSFGSILMDFVFYVTCIYGPLEWENIDSK